MAILEYLPNYDLIERYLSEQLQQSKNFLNILQNVTPNSLLLIICEHFKSLEKTRTTLKSNECHDFLCFSRLLIVILNFEETQYFYKINTRTPNV